MDWSQVFTSTVVTSFQDYWNAWIHGLIGTGSNYPSNIASGWLTPIVVFVLALLVAGELISLALNIFGILSGRDGGSDLLSRSRERHEDLQGDNERLMSDGDFSLSYDAGWDITMNEYGDVVAKRGADTLIDVRD